MNTKYRFEGVEHGLTMRRYWTNACRTCALKGRCTTGIERRITRWEHEHVLEVVQQRLDANPHAMRQRRETVEHPFGTMKARMGATHFLMKTLPKVAAEMALSVLAYNLTRVMNIVNSNRQFHSSRPTLRRLCRQPQNKQNHPSAFPRPRPLLNGAGGTSRVI
jgi:hypothetical protein